MASVDVIIVQTARVTTLWSSSADRRLELDGGRAYWRQSTASKHLGVKCAHYTKQRLSVRTRHSTCCCHRG